MTDFRSTDLYTTDVARGWLPWGALAPVLGFLFVLIAVLVGSLPLEKFGLIDARGDPAGAFGLMMYTLVPFGLLLLLLLSWVRFVERRPLASIGWVGEHKRRMFLQGHAIGAASIVLVVAAIWLAGGVTSGAWLRAWTSPSALLSIALLIPCFALQSSVEEIVFRGWLLSVVAKKFNVPIGVLLSSALFALLHFHRGQLLLVTAGTFLFGMFACFWVLRTRSVLGTMGWHSGWNWLLAVGFNLPLTGLNVGIPSLLVDMKPVGADWLTGGEQGPEGSLFCLVYFIVGCAWLLRPRPAPLILEEQQSP